VSGVRSPTTWTAASAAGASRWIAVGELWNDQNCASGARVTGTHAYRAL
jgi:hypothetical protein